MYVLSSCRKYIHLGSAILLKFVEKKFSCPKEIRPRNLSKVMILEMLEINYS